PVTITTLLLLFAFIPLETAVRHRVAFLTGLLDIKGMTGGRSAALLLGTALSIPLVWYLGMTGGAIQLGLIAATITFALNRRIRAAGFRPWAVVFDARVARAMALFGAASVAVNFASQGADLLVRSTLIRAFDAAQNGIYQSAIALLNPVKTIVLSGVS